MDSVKETVRGLVKEPAQETEVLEVEEVEVEVEVV